MRISGSLAVTLACLSVLPGCGIASVTEIPPSGESDGVDRLIIHYTVADAALAPYARESCDDLLSAGELPANTELLLFASIEGEAEARLHRRTIWGSRELSREELGIPDGGEARLLDAILRYAREERAAGETHLIISGRGSFGESVSVAGNSRESLEIGELAEFTRGGWLHSITLESSYGAAFSILYELRGSAKRVIASPGVVSLRGLSDREFLAGLARGARVEEAVIDAFASSHRGSSGAAIGSFELSSIGECGDAIEALLGLLEGELADPLERVILRDLLFDPSPYQLGPGPLFLSLELLAETLRERYPALNHRAHRVDTLLERVSESSWSSKGGPVVPSIYLVSLDEAGAPEGHAACYLPERPGVAPLAFVSSSLWPPRLLKERGILYLLWYDLLPSGGAQ